MTLQSGFLQTFIQVLSFIFENGVNYPLRLLLWEGGFFFYLSGGGGNFFTFPPKRSHINHAIAWVAWCLNTLYLCVWFKVGRMLTCLNWRKWSSFAQWKNYSLVLKSPSKTRQNWCDTTAPDVHKHSQLVSVFSFALWNGQTLINLFLYVFVYWSLHAIVKCSIFFVCLFFLNWLFVVDGGGDFGFGL